MKQRIAIDISSLPSFGFGPNSTPWWGTMAFIALEGIGFAIAIGVYLYLETANQKWPIDALPPDLWAGTLMSILLVLSVAPGVWTSKIAHQFDLARARIGLIVMSVIGLLSLLIRAFEFSNLNISWDTNAYGSIVWVVLGLHTTHLATDVGDTLVLTVLMFTRHATPRRFSDITDNAFYWNFVVLAWLPLYFLLYWVPRL